MSECICIEGKYPVASTQATVFKIKHKIECVFFVNSIETASNKYFFENFSSLQIDSVTRKCSTVKILEVQTGCIRNKQSG